MPRFPVGERTVRRLRRVTGLDIVWASGDASSWLMITTADHRHGEVHTRLGLLGGELSAPVTDCCLASCADLFADGADPVEVGARLRAEAAARHRGSQQAEWSAALRTWKALTARQRDALAWCATAARPPYFAPHSKTWASLRDRGLVTLGPTRPVDKLTRQGRAVLRAGGAT